MVTEVVVAVAVVVLFGEDADVFGGVRIVGRGGGQVLQVGEAVVGTGGVDGVAVFVKERAGIMAPIGGDIGSSTMPFRPLLRSFPLKVIQGWF